MHTLERLFDYRFSGSHLRKIRLLGEFRGRQQQTIRQQQEILSTLRQIAIMDSVDYSHRLENIAVDGLTLKKLTQFLMRPVTPLERQVAGYRDALDMVIEPAEYTNISSSFVRQLHATLYSHFPHEGGRWKATNKEIVERDSEGNRVGILYRSVPASDTARAVERTVSLYHRLIVDDSVEPLLVIGCTVLDFLCVQPFSDGNGQIARLLAILMLSLNGYSVCCYVSLERVFAECEQLHMEALKASVKHWHEGEHDPLPWLDFFISSLIHAYELLDRKVEALAKQGSRAPKSQLIEMVVEDTKGPFSVADICMQLPSVSRELVKKVVQQQRKMGVLRSVGKGRSAHWEKM